MERLLILWIFLLSSGSLFAASLPITVLYKKDSATSAQRLDAAVQSALQAFDEKLLESGLEVIQPAANIYDKLDAAQGVIVTFSADAGYSLLLDVVKSKRPYAGTDMTYAESRLRVRVYHGRKVIVSHSDIGSVAFKHTNAEDKAFEAASRRAVLKLTPLIVEKIRGYGAGVSSVQQSTTTAFPPPPPPVLNPTSSHEMEGSPPISDPGHVVTPVKKWALMIGVEDFSSVRSRGFYGGDLKGVGVDMKKFRAAFADLGIRDERLIWLYNQNATVDNIQAAFSRLRAEAAEDDLVYIYLSTHGMSKEGGMSRFGIPITYDFSRDKYIDFEQFRAEIGRLKAKNIVWINDTCHSGLAADGLLTVEVGSRDFGIASPSAFDVNQAANLNGKNIAVISSATGNQKAVDLGPKGGLFSFVMVSELSAMNRSGKMDTAYSFFKNRLDGKVQDEFRRYCQVEKGRLCTQEGGQQPVFGAQGHGKNLQL